MTDEILIRWIVKNPLNQNIILKQSTYEKHIVSDHEESDANFRTQLELQAKSTIVDPDYIAHDKERDLYYRLVAVPCSEGDVKFKTMKVIAESKPLNEIVTWLAQSKNKDTVRLEAVIYARNENCLSDK